MDPGLITERDVRGVLRQLLSRGLPLDSKLLGLAIVAEQLASSSPRGGSPEARAWALTDLLGRWVWSRLAELRGGAGGQSQPRTSGESAREAALADFRAGSVDREAWSCLYHRYLAPEPYSVQALAQLAQPGAPHGRRYISRRLDRGYTLLANLLRELERDADRRLVAASLPHPFQPGRGAPIAAAPSVTEAQARLLASLRASHPIVLDEADGRLLRRHAPRDLLEYQLGRVAEWSQGRYRLDRSFVRLRLLLDRGADSRNGRWVPGPQRLDDLETVLAEADGPAVVILGPPGSGKSTLLRHLELQLALRQLREPGSRQTVSVFLSLARYPAARPTQPAMPPGDWLAGEWSARFPHMPSLDGYLDEGRVLLLLDALNEIPAEGAEAHRGQVAAWKDWLLRLQATQPGNRVVFTCRSLEYSAPLSSPSLPVPQVLVEALDDGTVRELLCRTHPEQGLALWSAIAGTPLLEAVRVPYVLTLLAEQVAATGELVPDLAGLFTGIVRRALQREVGRDNPVFASEALWSDRDGRRLGLWAWRDAYDLPEHGTLLRALSGLADRMQQTGSGSEARQVRVSYESALAMLDDALGPQIVRAGEAIGVLDEDLAVDEVLFSHQLLQEYFAARELARRPRPELAAAPWRSAEIQPELRETLASLPAGETLPPLPATGWEETVVLAGPMLPDPEAFLSDLMPHNLALAARSARSKTVQGRLRPTFLDALRQALAIRSRDRAADLRARIEAALALGWLGDPRLARRQGPDGVYLAPPMVAIPAGTYVLGQDEPIRHGEQDHLGQAPRHQVSLGAFWIAECPVTVAEYARFMAAGGYEDARWWDTPDAAAWRAGRGTELARRANVKYWWRRYQRETTRLEQAHREGLHSDAVFERWQRRLAMTEAELDVYLLATYPDHLIREPGDWRNSLFNQPAQPVTGVCWFEARAYCLWLAAQAGEPFRLPTEAEWEAAARGPLGRRFAFGDSLDPLRANVRGTRFRRTTPVGVFPEGATPEGAQDMTGNVVEWTSSLFGELDDDPTFGYPYDAGDGREDPMAPADILRVGRGGSWRSEETVLVCCFRSENRPAYRAYNRGFRLALSA